MFYGMRYQMLIVSSMLAISYSAAFGYSEAKISLKIIGEDGSPVPKAKVGVTYQLPKGTKQDVNFVTIEGYSDAGGFFSAANENMFRDVSFGAEKEGYYSSSGIYEFKNSVNGRWQPWNPVLTLVLRKKIKPVPIYHREADIELPVIGKAVGFDLIEYDWVPPYGKGKHADFIFKLEKKFRSRDEFDSTLMVSFSEKHDGIQVVKENRRFGSSFKLPRFAPKSGYQNELTHLKRRSPGKPIEDDYADDNNYIFRIRSEKKDGKLWKAMYGKVLGEIRFDPMMSKTAYILFEYYLNPDYTRNLEPDENLFKMKK